ncbi:MAG TPA: GDYXXLXY domain-containing protein [Kiritimatiellia bacterium]|nr:GDYXXLXY domain-containing protein [Kiritimatiellia bacterium]
MNRRWLLIIALIGLMAQCGVMGFMIIRREIALRNGAVCRFLTAPVDPYDAFRGRYVALSLAEARSRLCDREYLRGQRIYAVIGEGTNGYNAIERLTLRPEAGAVYIQTRVLSCREEYRQLPVGTNDVARAGRFQNTRHVPTGRYHVHFALPFDRFYMEEKLAPEAEKAYFDVNRRDKQEGVAVVRVWRGLGVIEDIELGGRPIRDVARERLKR